MKLGIIGLGRRMGSLLNIFLKEEPDLIVAGVVDAHPEAARDRLPERLQGSTPFFDSLASLVKDSKPDAPVIGTRCDSQARIAAEAAAIGLPLFLEKPVATSLSDAIALEEAFRSSKSPTLVSFPLRASALCRQTRALLERGDLGRVEHLLAVNYVSYGQFHSLWVQYPEACFGLGASKMGVLKIDIYTRK